MKTKAETTEQTKEMKASWFTKGDVMKACFKETRKYNKGKCQKKQKQKMDVFQKGVDGQKQKRWNWERESNKKTRTNTIIGRREGV